MAALGLPTRTLTLSKLGERSYRTPSHLTLLTLTVHPEVCFHGPPFFLLVVTLSDFFAYLVIFCLRWTL